MMRTIFTFFITHQLIIFKLIFVTSTPIKVLDKGLLLLERNSIAMQFYLDLENEDKSVVCHIYFESNRCCLFTKDDEDCNSVRLSGRQYGFIKPKDRKMFLFFYLTMVQLNREGYCDIIIKNCCGLRKINKTQEVNIHFDTRPNKNKMQYLLKNFNYQKPKHCNGVDEDPLNDCLPVNCDFKYHGAKPFYDKINKKCVEVPECVADPSKTLPDIVYEPINNSCKDLDHALTIGDIYAINSGLGVVTQSNITTEGYMDFKPIFKPNCSTISQNVQFLRDMLLGKLSSENQLSTTNFQNSCSSALRFILSCIFSLSLMFLLFVCCANITMYTRQEWKSGNLSRKMKKFKSKIKSNNKCEHKNSTVNRDITNKLLGEVIVSDLPLELRNSVVDICERIGKEVRWKKRYRMIDVGSEINLKPLDESTDTSTTSDLDHNEKEKLLR